MISFEQQQQITQELQKSTGVNKWVINEKPEIEARDCIIYKAVSNLSSYAIAIKIYRKYKKQTSILQYDSLVEFSNKLNPKSDEYKVPELFGCFPDLGIFLMEWIESPTLEKRLWRYFYSKKHVQSDIIRSFQWLKEFHKYAEIENKTVDLGFYFSSLEKNIEINNDADLLLNKEIFKNGKMCLEHFSNNFSGFQTLHANLHGDFTPSNILIDDKKVTGIDIFGHRHLPVANDIALQLSYIAIEYPNMLTRYDFKLPPSEWPLLQIIFEAYEYPKSKIQLDFFLFVLLFQLLRRWNVIYNRNLDTTKPMLDRWRLRNTEMIVKNLTATLKKRNIN